MVKTSTKRVLVLGVVVLLVGYVLLGRSCGVEHMTPQESELAAAQKDWDSYVKMGFNETNVIEYSKTSGGHTPRPVDIQAKAAFDRLNKAKSSKSTTPPTQSTTLPTTPSTTSPETEEPVKTTSSTSTMDTTTIVLIVVGSLAAFGLLVGLGIWGYRKFTAPPAYMPPPYGARRR